MNRFSTTASSQRKSIQKSCTSSPWHISDRSECWPMPSPVFFNPESADSIESTEGSGW